MGRSSAGRDLENFVINDLSNWYVRRSRRRLWDEADSNDKRACQHTLHEVLCTVSKLMAPVSPFMSDRIHYDLTGISVHMTDWPMGSDLVEKDLPPQDLELEKQMAIVRNLTETGRRIRVDSKRRQRLPCQSGWIVGGPDLSDFHAIIAEELNVENLETEDGYAKEASDDFKKKQEELLADTLKKIDIVICTALIPGKKAPLIIKDTMINNMQSGS